MGSRYTVNIFKTDVPPEVAMVRTLANALAAVSPDYTYRDAHNDTLDAEALPEDIELCTSPILKELSDKVHAHNMAWMLDREGFFTVVF